MRPKPLRLQTEISTRMSWPCSLHDDFGKFSDSKGATAPPRRGSGKNSKLPKRRVRIGQPCGSARRLGWTPAFARATKKAMKLTNLVVPANAGTHRADSRSRREK